jgi:hypothetical protein
MDGFDISKLRHAHVMPPPENLNTQNMAMEPGLGNPDIEAAKFLASSVVPLPRPVAAAIQRYTAPTLAQLLRSGINF